MPNEKASTRPKCKCFVSTPSYEPIGQGSRVEVLGGMAFEHDKRITTRPFDAVANEIIDATLLMKRADDAIASQAIAVAGRSPYCHAAMAARWNERVMCLEMVEEIGGRVTLLKNLVAADPGRWDVFETNPAGHWRFNRTRAVQHMIDLTGTRYGSDNLTKVAFCHLPILRWFRRAKTNDQSNGSPPFCSQAVAAACRAGGADPVLMLADSFTEPGDLARSRFFRYRCTLV